MDQTNRVFYGAVYATALAIVWLAQNTLANLWIINGVNLAFHEGGHIIFGLLGNRLLLFLGGTLMQLILPAACYFHLMKQDQRIGAGLCLLWFGQNFLGIGQYMADARAQVLPLVGSGEHDWTYLLEVFGVLIHDVGIGRGIQFVGCLIMAWALTRIFFALMGSSTVTT